MNRPSIYDESVCFAAAEKMVPSVMEWLRNDGDPDTSEEAVREDLCKAIRHDSDGYSIAKRLDFIGWCPDAELVEILDGAFLKKWDAKREADRRWVIATGIKPPPPGARVARNQKEAEQGVAGTVLSVSDDGHAVVNIPALGHVPSGKLGTQGIVVPWESLVLLDARPPEDYSGSDKTITDETT